MSCPTHPQLVAALAKPGAAILETLDASKTNLWHAATGIAGEGTELLDAFLAPEGTRFDMENIVEELGDLEFYMEMMRQELDVTRVEPDSVQVTRWPIEGAAQVAVAAGDILDLVKKVSIANKSLEVSKLDTALHRLDKALASIYVGMAIDRETVLEGNIDKLSVRYVGLRYSDQAALARADKA